MATPKLRFKEFDEDWTALKYEDILNIKYGKDHKKLNSGNIPVFGTGGVMRYVDQFLHDGESILIGRKGTIDSPKYVNEKFWTVDTLFYTEIKEQAVPKFVYQHALQVNWLKLNEATGVPSLNTKSINNVAINLPPLKEQTKIATFLSAVDTKIDELTQKHELLTDYKKGMMQQIFSQKVRFKGFSASWNDIKVGSLGTFNSGGTPSKKNSAYWKGDIPWISSSDLTEDSIFEVMTTRYITREAIDNSATKIIPKNSVLIVSRVGVGKVAVNSSQLCTSQDFTSLTPFEDNPVFLAYLLKSKASRLLEFNQGTSIKGFVRDDLINLSVSIPTKEEQTKIADFLTTIDQKIDNVAEQIDHAKTWKKGLLQQMFV